MQHHTQQTVAPEREFTPAGGSLPAAGVAGRAGSRLACTVCMINYNGESHLDRSLSALAGLAPDLTEVVVVDNASTDGSRELIRSRFPWVRLVVMPGNLGASAARNAALHQAGTELVLLIDNDVSLAPGSLERLIEALRRDPAAVAAVPAIVYGGDPDTVQYDGGDTHFLGQQILHNQDVPFGSHPRETRSIGSLASACLLVDRSRLPEVAPGHDRLAVFDEDFFIYFEDHDFGFRMRAMGRNVLAVPAAFGYHGVGTPGLSIRATGSYSPLRVFCHVRNRWLFLLKNYSLRTLILLAPVLLMYEAVQFGAVVKKGWSREWFRALGWVARHRGAWYRQRRWLQRHRQVGDRALLHGGPVPLRQEAVASRVEQAAKRWLDAVTGAYWAAVRGLV